MRRGGGVEGERGGKRWICETVFFQCEMYMYDIVIGCYFGLKTRLFKNVLTTVVVDTCIWLMTFVSNTIWY